MQGEITNTVDPTEGWGYEGYSLYVDIPIDVLIDEMLEAMEEIPIAWEDWTYGIQNILSKSISE